MGLPTDCNERKALPVYTFLTKYFPLAFLEVVRVAVAGDKQHLNNSEPGEIRWAREKSTDQLNTALRHIMDYGMGEAIDTDGRAHLAKAIWRLSAQLQLDEEARAHNAALLEGRKPAPPAYEFRSDPNDFWMPNSTKLGFSVGTGPVKPRICSDCGADLDEGGHAATCLLNS